MTRLRKLNIRAWF